jgi:hypothetical protein
MHHHCEIVIPPTTDIEGAIASVMKPFDEQGEDEDGERNANAFWDFYVVGGRWAGTKQIARYDEGKLQAFYDWMTAEKVTVSGLTAGKQEISPADQIPKVDAKWNEMFPSSSFAPCPMFKHSNDQYAKRGPLSGALPDDVCRLVDVPPGMEIDRVIFAGPSLVKVGAKYEAVGPLEATFMLQGDTWNGVNFVKAAWDGKMPSAVAMLRERMSAARATPHDDWLSVTVDYHS